MQLAVRSGRQSTFTWRLFDGLAGSLLLKSQDSGVDVAAQGPMAGCHRGMSVHHRWTSASTRRALPYVRPNRRHLSRQTSVDQIRCGNGTGSTRLPGRKMDIGWNQVCWKE